MKWENQPRPLRSELAFDRTSGPNPVFCKYLNKVFETYVKHFTPGNAVMFDGAEYLPAEGPYILSPNHISQLDTALVGKAVLDYTSRHVHFMAKREYWDERFGSIFGRFVELGGGFPINRGNSLESQPRVLERVDDAITNKAEPICIYPQGGRRDKAEKITKIKGSIAYLAIKYGVPVFPVGIAGTEEKKYMTIYFGDPLYAEHIDFDIRRPRDNRDVVTAAGHFRRELAEDMQDAKDHAEILRNIWMEKHTFNAQVNH